MRSAETLNSAARSCSVAPSFSCSQRASTMRRLRGIERGERVVQPRRLGLPVLFRLQHARRLGFRVGGEVVHRRVGRLFVALVGFEGDVAAGQAHLHLGDFLRLHVQLGGEAADLLAGERGRALLHRAQIEEQFSLRLGGGDFHQPPVAQDVLVDLGLDPVDRERDEAHAARRVEALDRLHQADVALLDQVGVRQAVAEVAARDRDDQTQVRQHQLARGIKIVVLAQADGERALLSAVSIGKRLTAWM